MNVNIYVNGRPVTPQQQRELTVKNEIISKIIHGAAARYDHPGALHHPFKEGNNAD